MTVQDDIRHYIIDELGWSGDPAELTDDLDLIENQVLDSLSVVEFSVLLEQRYGVQVRATELVYEHFHSLRAIAAYVARRQPAVP
jgi:acyl carrier protein